MTLKKVSRTIFITLALFLFVLVAYDKIAPFGKETIASKDNIKNQIVLGPPNRVTPLQQGDSFHTKLLEDLAYFTTDMPSTFDQAKVKVIFYNNDKNQTVQLGFQDQESWHYQTQTIDIPFLDLLTTEQWSAVGTNPTLFQKSFIYDSLDALYANPPQRGILGTVNFEQNILRQSYVPNYIPKNEDTIIDTPLRGRVIFYTYVSNEPFKLSVWKQDLNWYEDPDVTTISIYKEQDIVYSAQIEDDGIIDSSRISSPVQQVYIENPGPGLPEPGVYKVVIDSGQDSVIMKIQTNLHKLMFEQPLFPVSNADIYPTIVKKTIENHLFTDAHNLSFLTNHLEAVQEVKIGSASALLNLKEELSTPTATPVTEISLPKSDIQLKGKQGYFFFNQEHYFQPTRFKVQTITDSEDLEGVEYIIANYTPPTITGDWKVAEATFDLTPAVVKNKKLSWIVKAPGLKERGNELIIKSIEVELTKKPLINLN